LIYLKYLIMSTERFRSICFTLNNYTECEFHALKTYKNNKYYCIGREVGENGTPHLQGYLEFKNQVSYDTLKKEFPKMHFERRRGSPQQASDYCKKDGKFEENGTISNPGKRTDLELVAQTITENKNLRTIALEHPESYIKYHNGIEKLRNLTHFEHRDAAPNVFWLYGKSGTGKTRYVADKHPDYYLKNSSKWWDGYEQQETVLIDDYDFDHYYGFRELLRLLDRYKYQVEVKGSVINFNSPYIYITSEFPPEHFFGKDENTIKQILRPIKEVKLFE